MLKTRLGRYTAWIACIALFALGVAMHPDTFWGWTFTLIPAALAILGLRDRFQNHPGTCSFSEQKQVGHDSPPGHREPNPRSNSISSLARPVPKGPTCQP